MGMLDSVIKATQLGYEITFSKIEDKLRIKVYCVTSKNEDASISGIFEYEDIKIREPINYHVAQAIGNCIQRLEERLK